MPPARHVEILPQPDDVSCGPTCLHAVYRYHGEELDLTELIGETRSLESGGTLAVLLAIHALRRGYGADLYTYNLRLFDPTWFAEPRPDLAGRLRAQAAVKRRAKLTQATNAYLEYLELGGRLHFEELTDELLQRHLSHGRPLLTGLSATYLYRCAREIGDDYDDVRGEPSGHFVVLSSLDPETRSVRVADPYLPNPVAGGGHYYDVSIPRLLGAIMLGIVTYDANLLVLEPPADRAGH